MLGIVISTLISTVALGAGPVPCPEGQVQVPGAVGTTETTCRDVGMHDDAARYAEMEAKTPAKVKDFQGGDGVVYVSTGAAIVILVVLLIVLL